MLNLIAISDIHGYWHEIIEALLEYKDRGCEILVICGDLCSSDSVPGQEEELKSVFGSRVLWKALGDTLRKIIICPGNHDYYISKVYQDKIKLHSVFGPGVEILVDNEYDYLDETCIKTWKIWGSPRCNLWSAAFPRLWGNKDLNLIPGSLDILVTHETPRSYTIPGILGMKGEYGDDEPGDIGLFREIQKKKPRYTFCGHIHWYGGDDTLRIWNTSQMWKNEPRPKIEVRVLNP